jgi:pentose-5-phosphate-3-epimerase
MPVICPAILAADETQYRRQIEKVGRFAERIQIDLTDGDFAGNKTVSPEQAWWPVGVKADFHLMYKDPTGAARAILEHKPNMLIVHGEAEGNFASFVSLCRGAGVKVGVALLARTPVDMILPALDSIDHVLIFSGELGRFGGHVNLDLLNKVNDLRQHRKDIEIGWDGGINDQNISQLAFGGIDVFNVGGFIQSSDDPEKAYQSLVRIAQETGTA